MSAVRFSITMDPRLLEEAMMLAQVKTKRAAIEQALEEFVRRRRVEDLKSLVGSGLVEMTEDELRQWRKSGTRDS